MSTPVSIAFESLESALNWSSSAAPYENEALLSRATGEVFLKSMHGDFDDELPEDIEDGTRYIAMPHKNDLDLGRSLVFQFVESEVPQHSGQIASFFRQRGAYAKYKMFL